MKRFYRSILLAAALATASSLPAQPAPTYELVGNTAEGLKLRITTEMPHSGFYSKSSILQHEDFIAISLVWFTKPEGHLPAFFPTTAVVELGALESGHYRMQIQSLSKSYFGKGIARLVILVREDGSASILSADPDETAESQLEVAPALVLRVRTEHDRNYQIFRSSNLVDWHPLPNNSIIFGDGQEALVYDNVSPEHRFFYRAIPIPND